MYIKENDSFLAGKQDLKQFFKNDFNLSVSNNEIVKMYQNQIITTQDMIIVEFIFTSLFATANQIKSFLERKGEFCSNEEIVARLDKLVQYCIFNKFILSDGEGHNKDEFPKDALQTYCLDLGGIYLIQSFTMRDGFDWMTGFNLKCSGIVLRTLFLNDFRLKILDTIPENLNYFRSQPRFTHGKTLILPSADLAIKNGESTRYLICDVFTEHDALNRYQEQAIKMELLLGTNAYKKYYPTDTAPPLIVITDNDYTALELAKRINETSIGSRTRYTTEDRLKKPLSERGVFLIYNPDTKMFRTTISSLFVL